ncbi:MAG: metallophosphoesterase [Acidimicrobiia bacterium]|nr:metallophosphoesterase [Acidimicrobiia bacterium]
MSDSTGTDEKGWPSDRRFSAQRMVAWLTPTELGRGALGEILGGVFGSFADKREDQAALRPATVHTTPERVAGTDLAADPLPWHGDGTDDLWIDYIADLGDGFSPTYAMARLISRESIDRPADAPADWPATLERGQMLVMGGDQVYPVASRGSYRDRTVGPYEVAFETSDPPHLHLFAIPGNHDWYDGLNAFQDTFTILRPADSGSEHDDRQWFAGWQRHQTRSYFAIELAHDWWLWGIDIALEADVDGPQVAYFRDVARLMPNRQNIILCSAEPAWLKRPARRERRLDRLIADPILPGDGWDRLLWFANAAIQREEVVGRPRVRLMISGDKHFYARHESGAVGTPTLVTAGGGGAYMSSTSDAPAKLEMPTGWRTDRSVEFSREAVWPSTKRSAAIGVSGFVKIPFRNTSLLAVFAGFAVLFGWAVRSSVSDSAESSVDGVEILSSSSFFTSFEDALVGGLRSPAGVLLLLLLGAGLFGLAKAKVRLARAVVPTLLHVVLQVTAMLSTVAISANIAISEAGEPSGSGWLAALWLLPTVAIAAVVAWHRTEHSFWNVAPLVLVVAGWLVIGLLALGADDGRWHVVGSYLAALAVIGGALGMFALSGYLVLAQWLGVNLNELFAGIQHEGYKHFVRLRIADDGVHGYAIGYPKVARRRLRWQSDGKPVVSDPSDRRKRGHVVFDSFHVPSGGKS